MKELLRKITAKVLDTFLYILTSFITGVHPQPEQQFKFGTRKKIYYANHNSHGDFILVWISLAKKWRMNAFPVAGSDYWLSNKLKAFIAQNVFKAILIDRNASDPAAIIAQMTKALDQGKSIIIFPEGTRNINDDELLLPFKSGLYYLAKYDPEIEVVPVWINNMNRVLPKGKLLPVPLLCNVTIGENFSLNQDESKEEFLLRARDELLQLSPPQQQEQTI